MYISDFFEKILAFLRPPYVASRLALYEQKLAHSLETPLSMDDLFALLTSNDVFLGDDEYNVLYLLTKNDKGRSILVQLFGIPAFNEALNAQIQAGDNSFCVSLLTPVRSGSSCNETGLLVLISRPRALPILMSFFDNAVFKSALLTHPLFQSALFTRRPVADDESSFFDWFFGTRNGPGLFKNMLTCAEFKAAFLENSELVPALLTPLPSDGSLDLSNTSRLLLDDLLDSPDKITLLIDWCAHDGFLSSLLTSDQFMDLLLNALNDEDIMSSLLYSFLTRTGAFELFTRFMTHDGFRAALLADDRLVPSLLAKNISGSSKNKSLLYVVLSKVSRISLLREWCADEAFKGSLLSNEDFIPTLFALIPGVLDINQSVLYCLMRLPEAIELFLNWCGTEAFREALIRHPDFVSVLLTRRGERDEKRPLLYWLLAENKGLQLFSTWIKDEVFQEELFSAATFFEILVESSAEGVYPNTSILYFLAETIQGQVIFQRWIETPSFMALITQTPDVAAQWMKTLFYPIDIRNLNTSGFAMLLNTFGGKKIIHSLMQIPLINLSFCNLLEISLDSAPDWIFGSIAGFSLLQSLIKHNALHILQEAVVLPTDLRNHFYVRELIRMGHLDPHIFLFLAATGSCDQTFKELLSDPTLSPWSTIGVGFSLLDVIQSDLQLNPAQREARLALLAEGVAHYSARISRSSLAVHLDRLGDLQAEAPKDATPPKLPLPLPAPYLIEDIEPATIILFNQHIAWILGQPLLAAYHEVFRNLFNNEAVRTTADFPVILENLQSLCAWMNSYLINQCVMPDPYPEWEDAMSLCDDGVITAFGEMFTEFSNQPLLASYLQSVQSESIARYARWFSIDSMLEVHVPQEAIRAALGIKTRLFREKDAHLRNWNATQRQWVAQTIMDFYIHREKWIDNLVQPLQINPSDYKIVRESQGKRARKEGIRISREAPGVQQQFTKKYTAYARSPLFGPSFVMEEFYAFIGDTTSDNPALETEVILRNDLSSALEQRAKNYLEVDQEGIFEPAQVVEMKQALLWWFLTLSSIATISETDLEEVLHLIDACADAVDGPALIKASIESHLDALEDVQIDNLFYMTPHHHSIFSILIKNPYFVEWLFGLEIHVVDGLLAGPVDAVNEVEPVEAVNEAGPVEAVNEAGPVEAVNEAGPVEQVNVVQPVGPVEQAEAVEPVEQIRVLEFKKQVTQPLEVLTTAILRSEKTLIAMESLLNESGTLFFWLFYFQQDPEREGLFKAILSFIFELPHALASYDSLMPIFYDMQRSAHVSEEDKTLVVTLLHARMKEQLQLGHLDDFWQTASHLITLDNDSDMVTLLLNNPSLLLSLDQPVNREIFSALVRDENHLILVGERLEQEMTLIQAELEQELTLIQAHSASILAETGFFSQRFVTIPPVLNAEPAIDETEESTEEPRPDGP